MRKVSLCLYITHPTQYSAVCRYIYTYAHTTTHRKQTKRGHYLFVLCTLYVCALRTPHATLCIYHIYNHYMLLYIYTFIHIYTQPCLYVLTYLQNTTRDTHTHTFRHEFIHSFIHSFVHSFVHSFIHSFVHLFVHSFIRSFIFRRG